MPAQFNLPIINDTTMLDAALKKLLATRTHALVVRDKQGFMRILTSKDLLTAKARHVKKIGQIRTKGFSVVEPKVRHSDIKKILGEKTFGSRVFGRSKARYVLEKDGRSQVSIVSRHEEYAGILSAGMACICTNCDNCQDSPPAEPGHPCPNCGTGRFDCY